ncbi:MAG: M55 family metallopeptidase [Clostridiales bacterium]|nr:M55 family metallopeptidase [Clostridiales bacterium]
MRLFISADIEGTTGISHWDETDYDRGGRWYDYFRELMTAEVSEACKGAHDAGAEYIHVKDAHDLARNIIPTALPNYVSINRNWSGHPFCMVAGLDEGFDALAYTGYHSPAHSTSNPLAHTLNTHLEEITINGKRASEYMIHSYIAAMLGIPVIFLAGDKGLCETARELSPGIVTVATNIGIGAGVTSPHPTVTQEMLYDGMKSAVLKGGDNCFVKLPSSFDVSIKYTVHHRAYKNSFYPGASLIGDKTVAYASNDYMEILRFFHFTT